MSRSPSLQKVGACVLTLALSLTLTTSTSAQDGAPGGDPDDIGSIDGIMAALYGVISGPVGQERDQDRFMSLFAEGARLIPTGRNPQTGVVGFRMWSPEDYWTNNAEGLANIGFTEDEIGRTTETFGNVTHVFTTYASFRQDQGDPDTAFSRGINSIQLLNDGNRWWIMSVFWDAERPDNPIPSRYGG